MPTPTNKPSDADVAAFEMFKAGAADQFAARGVAPELADQIFKYAMEQSLAPAAPEAIDPNVKLASAIVSARRRRVYGK